MTEFLSADRKQAGKQSGRKTDYPIDQWPISGQVRDYNSFDLADSAHFGTVASYPPGLKPSKSFVCVNFAAAPQPLHPVCPLAPPEIMETYKLVMPENLNHYGMLFGGYMLKWVDEIAWVAATLEYPKHRFVTIGMDKVEFRHGVKQGTILRFDVTKSRVGTTSVSYLVHVYRDYDTNPDTSIFTTTVTMVNVDDFGNKTPI